MNALIVDLSTQTFSYQNVQFKVEQGFEFKFHIGSQTDDDARENVCTQKIIF